MARPAPAPRGMTGEGLKKLLASLSDDPERAGELYLHIQGKLIRYFTWNSCPRAEDLADEVLDRVARRLNEGEQIDRPISYILGVARRVLLETKPRNLQGELPLDANVAQPTATGHDEAALACLDRCLEKLPPESRALLLEYYSPGADTRVAVRQGMADRMGLAVNALRNRVLRLRRNLELCLHDCRDGSDGKGGESDG